MRTGAAMLAAACALLAATGASGASGPVFSVMPEKTTATPMLPSAEVPNAEGSLLLPPAWTAPPLVYKTMPHGELNALWHRAGAAYGIPWQVLAAINKIESNFGRNMGPSSAGAVGWMQFMPSTWLRWGLDADGDTIADPWDPDDAVFAAARYLAAAGGRTDLERGVFAYNHADWYVRDVLELAAVYGNGAGVTFTLDRLQVALDEAQEEVARANRSLGAAVREARAARRAERRLVARVARAIGVSDRLDLERLAAHAGLRADLVADVVEERRAALEAARSALDAARAGVGPASFTPQAGTLLGTASYAGGFAFPVGGGPSVVSVGHDHHDYPAADIAAPMGAPVYAIAGSTVTAAWPQGSGACGIGFILNTADGREWTYCHLSYLEPSVQPGAVLAAGAVVGLVGSTGHSTGPHLHLQTGHELTYPQEEAWFRAFAGIAFSWQGEELSQPYPVAPFTPGAMFAIVDQKVFDVVHDADSSHDVLEFSLSA